MARTKTLSSAKPAAPLEVAHAAAHEEPHGFEFGGPIGASLITFGLPIVAYAFAFLCNDVTGCPAPSLTRPGALFANGWNNGIQTLKAEIGWPGWTGLISLEAAAGTIAWYALSLVLYKILPASEVQGTTLKSGTRLTYKLNSFLTAITILIVCAAGTLVQGADFPLWPFINRNYIGLLTSNILISYALAAYTYIHSFSIRDSHDPKREIAPGGSTGNIIYDFFIGREMNPRITIPFIGEVDIKAFMELRPGMLGWLLLDLAFTAKQYKNYGYVSDSMLLVLFAQTVYILDSVYMEPAILTTIDITTDGFGFMLSFGDLVWVPFTYSLQTRYLSVHPVALGPLWVLTILGIQGFGYYVFRASNSEKNAFRTDPNGESVQHLKFIETASGSRLLTSGWWGTARHISYLGDWLMSWAYCLPTLAAGYKLTPSIMYPGSRLVTTEGMAGYAVPVTYFYMLYFAILLVHREARDEEKCRRKYGKDWERYCEVVRWRIWPGVY
ncbi:Delta(14)-sterol reductase [Cryoendolithus antarcticus]|uniref:Delta(14)-sterol reductase n=1 Tax=Cryoendolithus antarcticus TaxID=1507870 RepID=A0A1V8SWA9_9PEZI|nr:Delta(14)-sterol reductase [Cryoendolithus antarcticus]